MYAWSKKKILVYLLVSTPLLFSHLLKCTVKAPDLSQPSIYQHPITNNHGNEISFCIVDLKYDGTDIKICEFGEGLESRFKGYDALGYEHTIWSMLWDYLATFNVPVWFTSKQTQHNYDYSLKHFVSHGGKLTSALYSLPADKDFQRTLKTYKYRPYNPFAGIVISRNIQLHSSVLDTFKAKYKHMILLGQATSSIVRSKYHTSKFFECPTLAPYKPAFKIYPKKYTPLLAQNIITDLASDIVVIKPLDAALGHGIILIEKENLDDTLKLILKNHNDLEAYASDMSYYYWKKDFKEFFIVEAYAPSKAIYLDDKPYDPTMRVMFCMHNYQGLMSINFFDAYWKLPRKSLEEEGSLTEKHKSQIKPNHIGSLPVSYQDFEMVKALLCKALPEFYLKMLAGHSHFKEPAV